MVPETIPEGLTFDDVLLQPARSAILPAEAVTATRITRDITLNIPISSAAMDTVTETRLAIALAREGGVGIIHKNMPVEKHAEAVDRVKRSESGMIVDPVTIGPDRMVYEALENTFADATKDHQDGLRLAWDNSWLHVRPSGTEPIVRLIAEAPTEDAAQQLIAAAQEVMEAVGGQS